MEKIFIINNIHENRDISILKAYPSSVLPIIMHTTHDEASKKKELWDFIKKWDRPILVIDPHGTAPNIKKGQAFSQHNAPSQLEAWLIEKSSPGLKPVPFPPMPHRNDEIWVKETIHVIHRYYRHLLTELTMAPLWWRNIVINGNQKDRLSHMRPWISEKSWLILAAGPRLDVVVRRIHRMKEKYRIACVDTALPLLCAASIIPDLVIALDAQVQNIRDFSGLSLSKESILAADIGTHPALSRIWPGPVSFFASENSSKAYKMCVNAFAPKLPLISSGGNVLSSAICLLASFGAQRIELVGADFAWQAGSFSHSTEAISSRDSRFSQTRLIHAGRDTLKKDVYENNDKQWHSSASLRSFAQWIEQIPARFPSCTFYQWPGPGIMLKNWNGVPCKGAKQEESSEHTHSIFPQKNPSPYPHPSIILDILQCTESLEACLNHPGLYAGVLNAQTIAWRFPAFCRPDHILKKRLERILKTRL